MDELVLKKSCKCNSSKGYGSGMKKEAISRPVGKPHGNGWRICGLLVVIRIIGQAKGIQELVNCLANQ